MSKTIAQGAIAMYRLGSITLADNDAASLPLDASGNLLVTPASGASFGNSTADGATFTQNTTAGGLSMGVYVASPQTMTTGKAGAIAIDVNRNTMVSLATLLAGENLTTNRLNNEPIYSFLNITTNTTTTVKSGAGTFHGFLVNNNGFTTAGTIKIYDNTAGSGTLLGTWTIPLEPPGTVLLATTYVPPQLGIDASFATGLTFVTATTAPAPDILALYR